jgi:hypothetical protein
MAYEMVMPYHLHMPSYFLETFTEYPYLFSISIIPPPKKQMIPTHREQVSFKLKSKFSTRIR